MKKLFYFDAFVFKSDTGELFRSEEHAKELLNRLQPQPAKLLELLLTKYPETLSREEIQEAVWPNVHVDFEGSMHFCIRQIRVALDDSAQEPQFIETIPRRGYRWKIPVKVEGSHKSESVENRAVLPISKFNGKRQLILLITFLFLGSLSLFFVWYGIKEDPKNVDKTQLGIMPLACLDTSNYFYGNSLSMQLLESFSAYENYKIIGPTTTSLINLDELWTELDRLEIDFFINGRFYNEEGESSILVEFIRTEDGVHLWVESFSESTESKIIIRTVVSGINEYFSTNPKD